jgi:hypothetical protein
MSSAHPAPSTDHPQADPYDAAGDAEYYCGMLDEVLEIALKLTRLISDEFHTLGPDKATIAFDRVTRVIRRSMMLAAKLSETRRKPGPKAQTRSHARAQARTTVRAQVQVELQAAIDNPPPEPAAYDTDNTTPDRLDSIGTGTVQDIIASLCKDLASAAKTLGKPGQRNLLLATTTHAPPEPPNETPPPVYTRGMGDGTQAEIPPNPARYRGSG